MPRLQSVPIQRKLRFVILATCTVALIVSSSALFALQYYIFQREYRRDLVSVAEMLSTLSAPAIIAGHGEQARTFFPALAAKPHIAAAFVVTDTGESIARYGRAEEFEGIPEFKLDGFHNHGGELVYSSPIRNGRKRLGTLVLVSDYRATSLQLHGLYASILVVVLATSFLVAVLVSSRLERLICGPIQVLADTARKIARRGDYSLRAAKEANDEVGEFTDSFNGMLEQIQQREAALEREIAERRRAEQELQLAQERLIETSRQAGMAEVATGVLHNVGNVLNSVNVSATLLAENLSNARTDNLAKAASLLRSPARSMADYLTSDPKGRLLPSYIAEASDQLLKDRAEALTELERLNKNIEHIKDIVAMQQTYARVSGVIETLPIEELIEDAIRMNTDAFDRHRIKVIREYARTQPASVDKHKVLQILVNLMRNAKYAIDEGGTGEKKITLRLYQKNQLTFLIEVNDTGAGIAPENLTRIFSHGFTTRRGGHGFGLHSAALAAQQMGGRISAHSSGVGYGARFVLELPFLPPDSHASLVSNGVLQGAPHS